MSHIHDLLPWLNQASSCASDLLVQGAALLNAPTGFADDTRVRDRQHDLPFYCTQAVRAFRGDESDRAKLENEIDKMVKKACEYADWVVPAAENLHEIYRRSQ